LNTGGLTSHTCIYGHGGVLSGIARKQFFWKGQKAAFLERPESSFSGKARKQLFWKGQKKCFSDFRRLGS